MIMIIIAVVVVLILLWVISTYNKFVKLQNKVHCRYHIRFFEKGEF